METFRIQPLAEADLDEVVSSAGGRRAHAEADRRTKRGADYVLGDCVIELKTLEEEGLDKSERQAKLASLFRCCFPTRPVIVLDPDVLPTPLQLEFDRIVAGPIKTAVSSARVKLKQSRTELPDTCVSVLWIINNGYTSLDHDSLVRLAARRARNDSSGIDGVVVSGCYFYGDTFDSGFLWPIDYVPININRPFRGFDVLRECWNEFSGQYMTHLVQQSTWNAGTKGPIADTQFEVDGVTFVRPAPPMGSKSDFFVSGRPRKSADKSRYCPPVAVVKAGLTLGEWTLFHEHTPTASWLGDTYADWRERTSEDEDRDVRKPSVCFSLTFLSWRSWADRCGEESVHLYALDLFHERIRGLILNAQRRSDVLVRPHRYILALTETIGQDCANDVSHIAEFTEQPNGEQQVAEIVADQRIPHEHTLALACAYAIARNIDVVMWEKDLRYAWM